MVRHIRRRGVAASAVATILLITGGRRHRSQQRAGSVLRWQGRGRMAWS